MAWLLLASGQGPSWPLGSGQGAGGGGLSPGAGRALTGPSPGEKTALSHACALLNSIVHMCVEQLGKGGASVLGQVIGARVAAIQCSCVKYDDRDDDRKCDKEAQDHGPDVQALGGGRIALGPNHVSHHLPVPGLHGVGERHEAQAAGVEEEGVEQGPDDVVGHHGVSLDVDHRRPRCHRALGTPQHRHLVFLLEHFIGWGHSRTGA